MYDSKPWLEYYDPQVAPEVEMPELTVAATVERMAAKYPDNAAFHFLGVTWTFRDLDLAANKFAWALIDRGCQPGDVVGINLPNIPQYLIGLIGALKAGCACSGVSPLLTPRELAYQLSDSKAKALVTLDAIFEHRLLGVVDQLPDLDMVVPTGITDFLPAPKRLLARLLKKVPTGKIRPIEGKWVVPFMKTLRDYPDTRPEIAISPDSDCLVQYTGGTTGVPKGTVLTHRNMVSNLIQVAEWAKPEEGAEVMLSGFPLFHLAGLAMAGVALCLGETQVLIPNPRDTRHIVKEIARHKPTILVNVPTLYMMLLDEPGFRKLDFSGLEYCLSGASSFPVESVRELESVVGEGKLLEVYGMTETSPIVTMNPRRGVRKIGSVGLPVSNTEIRIVDLETGGAPVPLGQEGELIISGPQVMKGYLNRPEETRNALREHDGRTWMHTGDVARMDEDGYLYIVDRAKDMLCVGGFKVFSRELEEKLYEYPGIEFCAVIGIPHPKRPGTDRVKLVAQLTTEYKSRDEESVKAELIGFCRENFAPYKVPKFVDFIDEMPLTAVGKVDKKLLRV